MVWDWLVRDSTVAWVTWVGTVVGVPGLLLGLLGLRATYQQARAARSAAEAALDAMRAMRQRLSIGDLGYTQSQLLLVKTMVQGKSFQQAQAVFDPLKRMIIQTIEPLSGGSRVAVIERNMEIIEAHIHFGIQTDRQSDANEIVGAINGLATHLAARERELKFPGMQ